VGPKTGSDEGYSVAVSDLWSGLARTLTRLDLAASEPDRLDDITASLSLRRLQYALHLAAEHAYGIEPPPASASAHAELADALVCARDATAAVAEAVSIWGAEGVGTLLHEWRGALFRVRLARMRLATPPQPAMPEEDRLNRDLAWPLAAFALALSGALAFVAGATLQLWPLWVPGLVAVCVSVIAYRPS
jgi:hypothetical protein